MQPSESPEADLPELRGLYPDFEALTPGQQRILNAALVLFAEKGYAATATGAIARQAGVAEGLVFKHFRNKKQLLLKLVRPLLSGLLFPLSVHRIREALSDESLSLESLLRNLLTERLAFVKQHHRLVRLVIQEIFLHPELFVGLQAEFQEQLQPLFEARLLAYQAAGEVRPMAFDSFFRLLLSALMGLVIPRVLLFPDYPWQEQREIEETVQTLVQGLAPQAHRP